MKKHKKLIYILITIAVLLVLAAGVLFGLQIRIENGAFCVGRSLLTPYTYTLYEDHAVLEKYYGKKEDVTIPDTIFGKPVTQLEYECFAQSNCVKTVELNESLEIIGVRAFAECENLVEVKGGDKVKRIEDCAFARCRKLETFEIGNQLESIGEGAFLVCETLKTMNSQKNLIYIGNSAFVESGLEKFEFNRDAEMGNSVFGGTGWIANQPEEFIICGDGNLIGYTGNDEVVKIPEGVKTLNGGCFYGTTAKEIYIPKTVTTMCDFIFIDCNNVRVYIPDSVVQMGDKDRGYKQENPIVNDDVTITIITTQGSYAEQYAKEYGVSCEIVESW